MIRSLFTILAVGLFAREMAVAQTIDLFELPMAERKEPVLIKVEEKAISIQSDSDFTGAMTIQQSGLKADLKSLGAPHPGSREIPPQLWQGSDAQTLKILMQRLKRSNDPALMQLIRDVLLAETVLPQGSNDQDFLHDRVQGLWNLAWYDDAERLMQIAPEITPQLAEIRNTIALQTFDEAALCPRPENPDDSIRSKKLEIFCLLKAGKNAEADLQTKLLQEIAPEVRRDGFTSLVNMILLQESTRPQETELIITPEPVHLLLARMGGITPHFPEDAVLSPQIQAMVMDVPALGIDQRLVHAEAAYAANAIGIDDLQRLQFARTFREAERENVGTLLQQFPSPNSRALLTQVLSEHPAQAEWVITGLQHGDQHGLYAQMLDSLMAYLPDQPSTPLARAHLAIQNYAKIDFPESEDSPAIWPLQQIIKAQTPPETTIVDEQDAFLQSLIIEEKTPAEEHFQKWQDWRALYDSAPQQRELILALLPSLDVVVPNLKEPEVVSGNLEDYGEALLNIVLHLSLPSVELDPNQVRDALYTLEHIGFGDVAKAYAARRLAILLAPV